MCFFPVSTPLSHALDREMRLYDRQARRLYLNAVELTSFMKATERAEQPARTISLLLAYTGMRLSEARTLTYDALQSDARVLSVRTLKQGRVCRTREIPVPHALLDVIHQEQSRPQIVICTGTKWPMPRITAYRHIKRVMKEAGISGPKASPKGLRHAFGVRAVLAKVPLNIVQRWLGHASMTTTAIYTTAIGSEQLELSDRMWLK